MEDNGYERITFLEFAKKYIEYLYKTRVIDDNNKEIRLNELKDLGAMSNEYKALMKKFNNCFEFFGVKDMDFMKVGNSYAIYVKDIDFFSHIIYEHTRPNSYLKNAKKGDIIPLGEEQKLLADVNSFIRIIKEYVEPGERERIINEIIEKTEYYYLCCVTDIRYTEGALQDIIDCTIFSSKTSAINPYYFLKKEDRISAIKRLRQIMDEFKKNMHTMDKKRQEEIIEQFEKYLKKEKKDIFEFLRYYTQYRDFFDLDSYAFDFIYTGVNAKVKM